ncbi:uncharacterized protein, partial [Choristoneura fumiferana]|uniref:uncharacterized protein n=1 Tax=Choristoneura fumiferana TaxID=7141 RepID=UPI003D159F25
MANKQVGLLMLSEDDALCWECHFFVRKVAAFRSRAARAQALLASALHQANVTKITSLSSLMMTPVYLDLDISLATPDLSQVNIKAESVKEECENTSSFEYSTEDTCNNTISCDGSRQGIGDDDESLLRVLNKEAEAKDDERICGEAVDDDIANASLKSLLSIKNSLIISIPPLANKYKDDILTTEIEENDVLQLKEIAKGDSENMLNQCTEVSCYTDNVYCDESSEEMGDGGDDILLPVLNKQTEAKGDEGVCGEALSNDLANASLKSLLSRKSTIISSSHLAKKLKNDTRAEVNKERLYKEANEPVEKRTSDDPDATDNATEDNFTVVVMSEEEMLKWRERKKNMPQYATNAPALRCEQCIEPFRNMILYKAHARRHEEVYGDFTCRICGLRSVSESALRVHTVHHYRLLKCKLCAHEWDGPNVMRQHCYDAHGIPTTTWDCDQCDRKYTSAVQLARHGVCHRVAACPACGDKLAQALLPQHLRLHNSVQRTCTVCGKEYRGDDKLAAHMKLHDPKVDEAAYCAECNMQFRTMLQYRNHLRYTLKHARSEVMPFKCDECGKTFLTKTSLICHIDRMHSTEKKFACSDCGQKFTSRTRRNYHARTAHKRAPARHICDYCGKAFAAKTILDCHINTHTGARPFACKLCDATFGHKSALYLHGRYKHKIKKKS